MSAEPFPIRPLAIVAENFRGLRRTDRLELGPGLTLIVGENAAGKSSLLNAVEWCLFGGSIARKASGIAERGEWEVLHRGAEEPVSVTLELAIDGGTARLERRRAANAKKSEEDELALLLPDGEELVGDEVREWMAWNQLPDWDVWRHAFCQHQELLRGRLTNGAERSLQLGRLLGLEDYQEWRARLSGFKPERLRSIAREELDRVEEELRHSLEAPGIELRDCEEELRRHGIGPAELNDEWLDRRLDALFAEARRLATRLDAASALPEPDSRQLEEVARWSRDWEQRVDELRAERDREIGRLRSRREQLETTLAGLEPARRELEDAQRAFDDETREHGGEPKLAAELATVDAERRELREREAGRNATLALLRQAAEEMERRAEGTRCPVCEQATEGLRQELVARVAREGDASEREAYRALDAREARLREQRGALSGRRAALDAARAAFEGLDRRLEGWVGAGVADPLRAAEERRRAWATRIEELASTLDDTRAFLERFRSEREVLELLRRWREASARTEAAAGDLSRIGAWSELQAAIDEAAELVVDLGALATVARAAQEERSSERVEAVNATLGAHSSAITRGEGVRVEVKATASRLSYKLLDGERQEVLPILNQAALNALSFALLFAQAEDRARRRLPAWLVLDDPGQSLDAAKLDGLARALEEIAERVPVLVASFPGQLESRLRRVPGCRVVELPRSELRRQLRAARGPRGERGMNPATYRRLADLRAKTDKEYGKLVQKLLAIALLETGAERLVERSIQGIDLEVVIAGRGYALEVKTCEADTLTLYKKDLEGLRRELEGGSVPILAVLAGGLLDEWMMVRYVPGEIPAGRKLSTFDLRPYRERELEQRVVRAFEAAVETHGATAEYERQKGLDRELERYPARELA